MKNIKYFLIVIVIFLSCKNEKNINNKELLSKKKELVFIKTKNHIDTIVFKENYIKSLIEGVWSESKEDNALFYIENDSIFYVEHQKKPLFIDIKDNKFSIQFNDYLSNNRILKLDKDSLVFMTNNKINKLYRVRE